MTTISLFIVSVLLPQAFTWRNLPQIPANRRVQYYLLDPNGAYNYGYDTGNGYSAQQSSDAANHVTGRYFYRSDDGTNVEMKYAAGVQGFVPENANDGTYRLDYNVGNEAPKTDDASYNFVIDTDDYQRQEASDAFGNIRGRYSYKNAAGTHDLSYVAGAQTGFLPTGGSLLQLPTSMEEMGSNHQEDLASTTPDYGTVEGENRKLGNTGLGVDEAVLPTASSGNKAAVESYLPGNHFGYIYQQL